MEGGKSAREDSIEVVFTREPVSEQWNQGFHDDSTCEPAREESGPIRERSTKSSNQWSVVHSQRLVAGEQFEHERPKAPTALSR